MSLLAAVLRLRIAVWCTLLSFAQARLAEDSVPLQRLPEYQAGYRGFAEEWETARAARDKARAEREKARAS